MLQDSWEAIQRVINRERERDWVGFVRDYLGFLLEKIIFLRLFWFIVKIETTSAVKENDKLKKKQVEYEEKSKQLAEL